MQAAVQLCAPHYKQESALQVQTGQLFTPSLQMQKGQEMLSTSPSPSPLETPATSSPVTINDIQRRKTAGRFRRTNSITSVVSSGKSTPDHPRVYTLRNDDNQGQSPLGFSRYSNGGANTEQRQLPLEELVEGGLARTYVSPSVIR